ncbi:MAG: ferredoxin [Bacilli bacterium]|nr:ferredoxin [Bacilli bacterium]
MKCFVNKDVCIGCGACTAIANNVFEIGDDGFAEAMAPYIEGEEEKKVKEVSLEEKDNVIDAAESCPVGAIQVEE